MVKMGLGGQFQRVIDQYDLELVKKRSRSPDNQDSNQMHFNTTLIKILTRCKIMYLSLHKIQVIFKLISKRESMHLKILDLDQKLQNLHS